MIAKEEHPALLVSFSFIDRFLRQSEDYAFRDWALDSGAFTAEKSGTPIVLGEYIERCHEIREQDPRLKEIFALDVIGDWKASLRNCELMWDAGIEAIPTYHVGSPEHALLEIADTYPKIALGGAVGYRRKIHWAEQCFARVWPKRIHGFGFGSEKAVMGLPWDSVDATSWEVGPCKFGLWRSFGQMSVRGSRQDLRAEVQWFLDLEKRARARFQKTMDALTEEDPEAKGIDVRLAVIGARTFKAKATFGKGEDA